MFMSKNKFIPKIAMQCSRRKGEEEMDNEKDLIWKLFCKNTTIQAYLFCDTIVYNLTRYASYCCFFLLLWPRKILEHISSKTVLQITEDVCVTHESAWIKNMTFDFAFKCVSILYTIIVLCVCMSFW